MKSLVLTTTLFIIAFAANAQNTIFLNEGRIEFEKRINKYAQMEDDAENDNDQSWKDLIKKGMPQFKVTYFDLTFNGNKTLFAPGRENADNNKVAMWWAWTQPAEDNTVFTDLDKGMSTSKKNIFDDAFLIQDSTRKIEWKITDETRTIAGLECRRANALIQDSIYVVAFYTDAITTTGGPESFTGLPGMILGLAIPHEHVTYFATKVYAETIPDAALKAPTKGKKFTNASLLATLKDRMKDWGKEGSRYIRWIMI